MTNRSRGGPPKRRPHHPEPPAPCPEPEMRRWPHPTESPGSAGAQEPAVYHICRALAYQSRLLAEIKTRLDRLSEESGSGPAEK